MILKRKSYGCYECGHVEKEKLRTYFLRIWKEMREEKVKRATFRSWFNSDAAKEESKVLTPALIARDADYQILQNMALDRIDRNGLFNAVTYKKPKTLLKKKSVSKKKRK